MSMKRVILEMGTGNDLYGQNYTKAARRAVQDALHHSSLTLFSKLGIDHKEMWVKVTIGVQDPDAVDCDEVAAELPRGRSEVHARQGRAECRGCRGRNPACGRNRRDRGLCARSGGKLHAEGMKKRRSDTRAALLSR